MEKHKPHVSDAMRIGITHVFMHLHLTSKKAFLNTRPLGQVLKILSMDLACVNHTKHICLTLFCQSMFPESNQNRVTFFAKIVSTITNCRQTRGIVRKRHITITRYQEDKQSKATSSVLSIKMIAKLE